MTETTATNAAAPIKVLVVEDQAAVLGRLSAAVRAVPALTLVGAARTVRQACDLVDRLVPDVVLADLGLPDGRGTDVIRYCKASDPNRDVIVVTLFSDDDHVIESIRAGATGYLLKDAMPEDIASAIMQVHQGGACITPSIARRVLLQLQGSEPVTARAGHAAPVPVGIPLSDRESEILRLVGKGLSSKEIGTALGISLSTVATHIKRIYQKLEVHSRGEAVYEAIQLGLA